MNTKVVIETKNQIKKWIDQLCAKTSQEEKNEQRRIQWRMAYATLGTIEAEGPFEATYVTTRDLSCDGLGFLASRKLDIGQLVHILLDLDGKEIEVAARVIHCTPTVGMYKIGVVFEFFDPTNN